MIRKAKTSDVKLVSVLAHRVAKECYPNLLPNKDSIHDAVTACISSPAHYSLVSCDDSGKVTGAIGVMVSDMLWAERKSASVVMFYAEVPGDGMKMLRQFIEWARGRRAIKAIGFMVDFGNKGRIGKLIKRAGLEKLGDFYGEYK